MRIEGEQWKMWSSSTVVRLKHIVFAETDYVCFEYPDTVALDHYRQRFPYEDWAVAKDLMNCLVLGANVTKQFLQEMEL